MVRVVCCVCKKVLQDGPEHPVSHSYCPECAKKEILKLKEEIRNDELLIERDRSKNLPPV